MPNPLLLYLANQASSGTGPTNVNDTSLGTALNLPITYGGGSWGSVAAGDGLIFTSTAGAVSGSLAGTKVATGLSGITQATLEVVCDTSLGAPNFGQIFGFQSNAFDGLFQLSTGGASGQVAIGGPGGSFVGFDSALGLVCLHAVLDTPQPTATNRLTCWRNGVTAPVNVVPTTPSYPAQNAAVDAGFTNYANNRIGMGCITAVGISAFVGPIYYAALYAGALTSGQIAANAAALLANNDANPNGGVAQFIDSMFFGAGIS